jgi:hypothetical protein
VHLVQGWRPSCYVVVGTWTVVTFAPAGNENNDAGGDVE